MSYYSIKLPPDSLLFRRRVVSCLVTHGASFTYEPGMSIVASTFPGHTLSRGELVSLAMFFGATLHCGTRPLVKDGVRVRVGKKGGAS